MYSTQSDCMFTKYKKKKIKNKNVFLCKAGHSLLKLPPFNTLGTGMKC